VATNGRTRAAIALKESVTHAATLKGNNHAKKEALSRQQSAVRQKYPAEKLSAEEE
jgi:hypothetical protein